MRVLETFTRWCAYLGVVLLLVCAMLNVGDITTRRAMQLNIVGMVDVTQLMVMACAFLCIPYTFMKEAHIDVDFVVNHFPARLRHAAMSLWGLVGAAFMGLVSWYAGVAAVQAYTNGDQSTTIGIPIILYWIPLLFGCVLSSLVCLAMCASYAIRCIREVHEEAPVPAHAPPAGE
jgi:TRAP-type C4-dicarboxylate transport system permease small subunit